ncbi:phosphoribosylglycinamide formyltransferase [Marinomonas sp. 15G1-11]|uniref:Phosphoribosylglycinamide formyltransferase n=1 Tax=Marinomonas phaeophyticola TaxID=3004091 RepID=A0ABT4JYD5_9GAMM|nr:phosphoribosylglycinamide formyltransferase [Marinomonas sp. 15G1-11]MCZ2723415.1 phosphoribosylglycinamide formyltransferase [Marinomonas sp. 15G1-11]
MSLSVVVLISGSGSNLQALIDQSLEGKLDIKINAVISNNANAFGLERASKAGIPAISINHKDFASREEFDAQLQLEIDTHQADLVILAGFMRILTEGFTRHYDGKMLNIHPSLLPKYKGLNTHQRAIDAGDKEHGVSVHFVTAELDAGAIVLQAATEIEANDNAETLAKKVHALEHKIYPLAVKWFSEKRLAYKSGKVMLDSELLPDTGIRYQHDIH